MPKFELLALRKKWFSLQAKDFIKRYFMGIVILVVFLPGVAVGENFNTLLTAISKPFTVLSQLGSTFASRQISLVLLITVFMVWTKAQRHAINGGAFAIFQQSLAINQSLKTFINIKMLLIGNHFLWPFVVASFFYLSNADNQLWLEIVRNIFLILLLLLLQYISIFRSNIKNITGIVFLSLVFILPISPSFESVRMVAVFGLMFVFVWLQLHKEKSHAYQHEHFVLNRLFPKSLLNNLYLQILFKSSLTSSLFRLAIIVGLFIGFAVAIDYWAEDYQKLTPYYLALEAILAYFVSGFYVSFSDQRNTMHSWFITLPIKRHFWLFRDIAVVLLLTILLHAPFYFWTASFFNVSLLAFVFSYHFLLLIICYPIRMFVTEKQTFITFAVLFIITAITLFNLS